MSKNSISKASFDEYPELSQADFDRAVQRLSLKPVEKVIGSDNSDRCSLEKHSVNNQGRFGRD